MKQLSHTDRGLKVGGFILIGLTLTSLGLSLTQMDWWNYKQRFSPGPSRLEAPYRYPFTHLLPQRLSLTATPQREIDFYQERVRLDPQGGLNRAALAMAYLKMGRATQEQGWYLLAEQNARRSLDNLPFYNAEAVQVLARVAEAQHDFREALRLAQLLGRETGALSIQVTANLALGDLQAARQAVDQLVERDPNPTTLNLQALVSVAEGKNQQALKHFHSALELEQPGELLSSVRTRLLLGRLLSQRGQLERARDLYLEALRIIPNYPLSLLYLAQLETQCKNYQLAEDYYHQAEVAVEGRTAPLTSLILAGQARLQNLQGDRARAEQYWQQAEILLQASLSGSKFGHRRELAQLLLERGHPADQRQAVALMQAEVQLRQDAQTLGTLALALSRVGEWSAARQAIQKALRSGIQDAVLLHRAGVIATALGHPVEAEQYFHQARRIDPTFDPQMEDLSTLTTTGS
uniref:Tetratricopeptide TPR_2 repeat protein n=1 Tax=Cyanothece sp. (strain PCC 7425 / ATCC 29141) TaxID=395961 RepID=B8HRN8_CYAP4